jgi:cephalosporin-C deacetylase-like acetyl esterase/lysophospholipase L1-like esterase
MVALFIPVRPALQSRRMLLAILVQGLLCATGQAAEWSLAPLQPDGIYETGDSAGWQVKPDAGVRTGRAYLYELRQDNLAIVQSGTLDNYATNVIETRDAKPGMLFLEIKGLDASAPLHVAGLAVDPRRIGPSLRGPRDFDRFWKDRISQSQRVPLDAQLVAGSSDRPGVEYFTLRMKHSDGGEIHGQLARPALPGRFPALVIYQWAGRPYPLEKAWVTERAAQGWLVLNIEPHDVLPDQPQAYYDALPDELKNYQNIGRGERDRNYFLRMYLADYRAVEYLASRPDWNGGQLVAMGTSMGGQQAICTAALNSKVTALVAHVPAGADMLGSLHGRATGYPFWPADDPAVQRTAPYFDTVNCASRVQVPALVSMGFVDTVTPPVGIWAMFNQLRGPKEVVPLVDAAHNHQSTAAQQAAYTRRAEAWLAQLRTGQSPLAPASRPEPRQDANSKKAHEQLLAKKQQGRIDVYFIGDSITRRWGASDPQYAAFLANWNRNFHGWNAGDFGWGADRIQNILWRLDEGELTGVNPQVIVIMAGTNNVSARPTAGNEPEIARDIADGIKAIVQRARKLAPRATILLMGITPRNDNMAYMPVINQTNALLARLADGRKVRFLNLNDRLADANGKLLPGMTNADQLHLAEPGYQVWADALRPMLTRLLGPPAATDSAPPPTGDPSIVTAPRN